MAAQLAQAYKELKTAFDSRPPNLQKCGTLLAKLKARLLEPSVETRIPGLHCSFYVVDWPVRSRTSPTPG